MEEVLMSMLAQTIGCVLGMVAALGLAWWIWMIGRSLK